MSGNLTNADSPSTFITTSYQFSSSSPRLQNQAKNPFDSASTETNLYIKKKKIKKNNKKK